VTQRDPLRRELIKETIAGALAQIPVRIRAYLGRFKTVYMSSGITTYYNTYLRRAQIGIAAAFGITLIITLLILTLVLKWGFSLALILDLLAISLLGSIMTGAVFLYYPYYKRHENKSKIENGIIYFLSYMTALSASGMTIERILERITEVETNPPLILLAKKFSMDVKLFGMDIRSALKDIAEMSPSPVFAKQIEGIRNVLATSGDMKTLLAYEVHRQIQVKEEGLKAKVNTLVYIGELYVAIMVVTPILFIMIIAILSILGNSAMGGSPVLQMNLLVFLGIPILGFIFTIILDQTLGSEE
jgi:archaeal flagellar protein FlaJ